MKKRFFIFPLIGLLVFGLACNSSSEKGKAPDEQKSDLQKDLDKVGEDLKVEQEKFKKEAELQIDENVKKIQVLKEKISKSKDNAKLEYEKQLEKLEADNAALKKKLGEYKAEGKENWDSFVREFNHDMESLRQSLENLGNDNVK